MNTNITRELLFDHFNGSVSARQRRLIDEWVKKPENAELFYKYLMEWELSRPQYHVDLQKGIEAFRERDKKAQTGNPETVLVTRAFVNNKRQLWLAAAWVVAVLGFLGWFFQNQLLYKNLSTGPGEIQTWTLEDGSSVSLNANSELTVPRWGFGSNAAREVYLTGEAEFSVTHKTNGESFIVKTRDHVDVIVLGTQFTVYSRPDKTEISLNKGKVQVQHQTGLKREDLIMAPGDMVTLSKKGHVEHNRLKEPAQYAAWKESRFVFDETSLTDIARLLENNYSLSVEIASPEIAALTISGSFKAQDQYELINSICRILDIRYKIKGKKVIFSAETKPE
ncbi:FecR family protein [Dyadobacter bucti]|uniref:FecR family protein n=1 Tax=Dyadobacter bucti TaxID=2572203 RepID=UPI0011092E27|nr:FecR domain-containing protein [Dyadobacter bucti]